MKTIRNTSSRDQFIITSSGARELIPPRTTVVVTNSIAEQFIEKRAPHVALVESDRNIIFDETYYGPQTWLYNTTGDKDHPKTVKRKTFKNKERIEYDEPNANRRPRSITMEYWGGQHPGYDADGNECFVPEPRRFIVLEPFSRICLPKNIADWCLQRDGRSENPGALRRAKKPSPYEPNELWSHNDLRVYAKMIGISAIGYNEAKIREAAAKEGKDADEAVERVCGELLEKIFFSMMDPQAPDVTRQEFEDYKQGSAFNNEPVTAAEPEEIPDDVDDLTRRNKRKGKKGRAARANA
jgi:hypothetical protein